MNGWNYVEGNPVNRVDPSGQSFRFPCFYGIDPETGKCRTLLPPAFGGMTTSPSLTKEEAAAKAIIVLLGYCYYLVSEQLVDNWPSGITVSETETQTDSEQDEKRECCPARPEDDNDDENIIRVRHYSQEAIREIKNTMAIKSGRAGPWIWIEYPVTTSYEEEDIKNVTRSFFRPIDPIKGGFVEFNVDLKKWQVDQDPNLPGVRNAKRISLVTLQGEIHYPTGYSLSQPKVNPEFFDSQGNRF